MPTADQQAFITTLQGYTGLSNQALTTWATAENGAGNNVLGISKDPGGVIATGRQANGFPTFATPQAGAYATYQFLLQNPAYRGILSSAGQSPQAQLTAIKASPWNTGRANDPSAYAGNIAFTRGLGGAAVTTAGGTTTPGTKQAGPGISILGTPFGNITIPGTATAGAAKLGMGVVLGIFALALIFIGSKSVLLRQSVTTSASGVARSAGRAGKTVGTALIP